MTVRFCLFSGSPARTEEPRGIPMGYTVVLLIIILTLRFALGYRRHPIPYDVLKVPKASFVTARWLSAGFIIIPLTLLVYPFLQRFHVPPPFRWLEASLRWLEAPLPVGILFCVPGLVVIHRLRAELETRGNQAKPVMAWLDRGVLAGWIAGGLVIVNWIFAIALMLPLFQ
jgi:hypothetical protein